MVVKNWLDRRGTTEQALVSILESAGKVYSQYRSNTPSYAGMRAAKAEPVLHSLVEMRIDPMSQEAENKEFVGITLNQDIQIGDVFHIPCSDGTVEMLRVTSYTRLGRVIQARLVYGD